VLKLEADAQHLLDELEFTNNELDEAERELETANQDKMALQEQVGFLQRDNQELRNICAETALKKRELENLLKSAQLNVSMSDPDIDRSGHLAWVAERRRLRNELFELSEALDRLEAESSEKDTAIVSLNKELTKISRKHRKAEHALAQLVTTKASKRNAARPERFS
jgi:chromosome segregation ATPase